MAEKKECVHCHRSIDVVARVCPYCNRDQDASRPVTKSTVPLPPIETPPQPRTSATKSRHREWSTRALLIAAVVALLTASFAVGGLVYGLGRRGKTIDREERPPQPTETLTTEREFPQLTLVTEMDPTSTIGQFITSAPVPDPDHKMPAEFQRTDATALPSTEYARIIEQQKKQEQQQPQIASADPRAVTAQQPSAVYAQPGAESRREPDTAMTARPEQKEGERSESSRQSWRESESSQPRRERTVRTEPVPVYQPLPRVKDREEEIQESGTMRFRLSVGRDGRVDEIRVLETMPGMTGKMIAAIQKWKFKPATENGIPVQGTFMVDISFNAPR